MIGRLAGRIDYRGADHVLIDVRGVGYLVHVSERTMAALPGPGEAVALYTDLLVREDLMQLFGFTSLLEKEWFRLLQSVQGVGAKAAMAILGALGPEALGRAIALGDWSAVKAAHGIGPKIAHRVVNELKDRAPEVMAMGAVDGTAPAADGSGPEAGAAPGGADAEADALIEPASEPASPEAGAAAQADALSALRNLGYAPGEAAAAVAAAARDAPGADAAALIRAALKSLAPKG